MKKTALYAFTICIASLMLTRAYAIKRSDVISEAQRYSNYTWTVVKTNPNYAIYDSSGRAVIGEAYSFGDKEIPENFGFEITDSLIPRNWKENFNSSTQSIYTGIDCSGLVTKCWFFDVNHVNSTPAAGLFSYTIPVVGTIKPGDLWWDSAHVFLQSETSDLVYEANPTSNPDLGQRVQRKYNSYPSYKTLSIFPQFSAIYPPSDTTINPGETVTIQLKAEGTKPSHKDNVVAEISNIQLWLDDSLVTPSAIGPKNRQTIKYKVDSLEPGKHRVKVQCDNTVNGNAYMDTVAWEFKVRDDRPGWINCTDNSNDISEYIMRVTIDPPTEFITPMDSLYWDEHLFYTEMSDTMWVWNGSLQNVSELKSLSIWGICPQSIYRVQLQDRIIYTCESRSDYSEPISWPSVEIIVDGVTLPVTSSKVKFYWLYENPFGSVNLYDTTYVFWLRNINWSASDAGIKDPRLVTVKVKPVVIVDPVEGEKVGMQVFNYPPDLIGDYFTQYIRQPCMVGYDGTGALIPYIGDSTTTAALVSDSRAEKKSSKSKQMDNTTSFNVNNLYPNPARNFATIEFTIPQVEKVELKIYNLAGQLVKVLINENMTAGKHQCSWDGRDESGLKVSQGVYLYKIKVGEYSDNKKLIWLK